MKNFTDFLTESLGHMVNESAGNYNVIEFDSPTKFSVFTGIDYEDYLYLSDVEAKYGIGAKAGKWDETVFAGDTNISGEGNFAIVIRKDNDIADCIMDMASDMNDFKKQLMEDIRHSIDNDDVDNILAVVMDGLNIRRVKDLPSYSSKNVERILNGILKMIDTCKKTDKDAVMVLDLRKVKDSYGKKAFDTYFYNRDDFYHMRSDTMAGLIEYPEYAKVYKKDYDNFYKRYGH